MRQVSVDTPRGRIECLRNAADAPGGAVSITVNGLAETSHRWGPALVQVSRLGHVAYAYDHRGQFESGAADPDCTVESLADDLRELIDELSPGRPVHVVGGCLGGFVARELAVRAPDRVRSLVLLGSGSSLSTSAAPRLHEQVGQAVAIDGRNAVFEVIRGQARKMGVSDRTVDRVRGNYLALRPSFLVEFSRSVAKYTDAIERFPAPGGEFLPVLVAHGSADDMWTAHEQQRLAGRLDARIAVIDGAGHSPTVTHPRATAELFARFWAEVDSGTRITPRSELDLSPS